MHPQLTLQFEQQNSMTFGSFFGGPNDVLYRKLQQISDYDSTDRQILIWGPADSGKTHLLTASCQASSEKGYRIAYLPCSMLSGEAVSGLSDLDLVCIDDLQDLPLSRESEVALFNLINAVRDAGGFLLFASRQSPAEMKVELPDLKTRLSWGAVFSLQTLSGDDIRHALKGLAMDLGLQLADDVIDYLLNHYPRDIASQMDQLHQLDQASLQAQRRVTIPLVREVLSVS